MALKQGEEEAENQNQETPEAVGEPASCEHQDERERLERESRAEKQSDGTVGQTESWNSDTKY